MRQNNPLFNDSTLLLHLSTHSDSMDYQTFLATLQNLFYLFEFYYLSTSENRSKENEGVARVCVSCVL